LSHARTAWCCESVASPDIAATAAAPILLRSERRRWLLIALLIVAVVIVVSVVFIALAGQAFGPDPMTGT